MVTALIWPPAPATESDGRERGRGPRLLCRLRRPSPLSQEVRQIGHFAGRGVTFRDGVRVTICSREESGVLAVKFIVTHGYIKYGSHRKWNPARGAWETVMSRDGVCELCNVEQPLIFDHCHAHGWIRGRTCQPCNLMLPAAECGDVVTALQAGHLANCPECPGIADWLAGWRMPCRQVPERCPAGCSNGLLFLRSLARLVKCPACTSGR